MDASKVKIYKQLGANSAPATDTLLETCDVNAKISYTSWWRFNEGVWSGATGEVIDSGGISHGKANGAVISNSGRFGNCGLFDGVDDWVEIPIVSALQISGAITVEWWIYPTPPHLNGNGGLIVNLSGYGNSRFLVGDNGQLKAQTAHITGSGTLYHQTYATNNAWNHVVWRFDGSVQHWFLNGVKSTSSLTTGLLKTGTTAMCIGWGYVTHSYYHFKGKIDGVRMFNSALTDDQITTLYNESAWLKTLSSLAAGRHKIYGVAVDLSGNQSAAGTVYNIGRLPVPMYVSEPAEWTTGELNNTYLGEIDVSV